MTDPQRPSDDRHSDDSLADEATDPSAAAWSKVKDRAHDEKREEHGEDDTDTAGMSPAPDVDLLADSMGKLATKISGRDDDDAAGAP